MNNLGRSLCLLALLLVANSALAAVIASVDRDRVAMGDTLRLTITATDDEEISDIDLSPLHKDFEILGRSTSSSTNITNLRRTHTKQILLDITPRRQGTLNIPPLRIGQAGTSMLTISVGPPPQGTSGDETVIFEAELDRDSVYVQGQVLLTLRVQQAINLDNRGVSELRLDDAFVKPLEQQSFQRTLDGRPWLVHEIRYAIFPEQSGTLVIPAQTFSARESRPRRSFFDLNGGGRQLRRTTEALTIEVLPRPAAFPGSNWLPARAVSIEESWSTPPEQLRAGESATRTITIRGEGVQGAQLPPVLFSATDGLKYYPDQPVIGDDEISSGLLGSRQDSAALVSTREGKWTIPEIRIPWWDTEQRELRYAVVPQREIHVGAANPDVLQAAPPLAVPAPEEIPGLTSPAVPRGGDDGAVLWQVIAATSSVGWLLTLAYLYLSRRQHGDQPSPAIDSPSRRETMKQLLAACADDDAAAARSAVIAWAASRFPEAAVYSTEQVSMHVRDRELDEELEELNAALYRHGGAAWRGAGLAAVASRLEQSLAQRKRATAQELVLYPA